jgi:hypothetical protein
MGEQNEKRADADALWEWAQGVMAKGCGQRIIALIEAVDDWMQVCHQQEAEIERAERAVQWYAGLSLAEVQRRFTEAEEAHASGRPAGSTDG